ncbi:MAG: hypothetical protein H7832_09070 [Magnetococcus sp. DMHC-6]
MYLLLFAFNGTGKTRLSMLFKELGKKTVEDDEGNEETTRDTLYVFSNSATMQTAYSVSA